MKHYATPTLLVLAATAAYCLTPYAVVDVEVGEARSYPLTVMQGETYEWRFRHIQGGDAVDLTGAESAALTYSARGTNYVVAGSILDATNGVASYVWASTNATPAGSYAYVANVSSGAVVVARARGTLTVSRGLLGEGAAVPVWQGATPATVTDIVTTAIAALSNHVRTAYLRGVEVEPGVWQFYQGE
jgi:hypothetical protein